MKKIVLIISIISVFPYLVCAQELSPARTKEVNKAIDKFESAVASQGKSGVTDAEKEVLKIGKDTLPGLQKVFKNKSKDNVVRHKAMELAAKLRDEEVADPLVSVVKDKSEEWYHRTAGLQYLGLLVQELRKDNKSVDKKYMKDLEETFNDESNNIKIREGALGVYGQIGQNDALPKLIEKLDDPKGEIRTNAVYGIGAIRTPEGEDALIQGYSRAKGTYLEGTYIHLFGFYKIRKATVYVMESLKGVKGTTNQSRATRKGYFDTLGELGDSTAIDTLISYTKSKDLLEAAYAASALCKIGDIRAKDAVESVIKRAEVEGRNWLLDGQPYSKDHIALRARYQKLISK